MDNLVTELQTLVAAAQAALDTANSQVPAPSVGDNVLAAITPVLTGAGWTEPSAATQIPVTTPDEEVPAE